MPKRHLNLPKSITYDNRSKKFVVRIYSKKTKKRHTIGLCDTVENAIKTRDTWLVNNYQLVEGYLPRGITKNSKSGHYEARISFKKSKQEPGGTVKRLGTFKTIQEAVDHRREFILGLL